MTDNTNERLQDLLLDPKESLDVEIKGWLDLNDNTHKSVLAKALIALANHGVGFVIIGFRENGASYEPDTPRPGDLSSYSQDAVNAIVARYSEPVFHCDVHLVTHPDSGDPYPIIRVPGSHTTPIRSKRGSPDNTPLQPNVYYIRRPGPKSEAPQTSQEWDTLIRSCVTAARSEMLDAFRSILEGGVSAGHEIQDDTSCSDWIQKSFVRWNQLTSDLPNDHPAKFQYGSWFCAYRLEPELGDLTPQEILEQLRHIKKYTGWAPFWVPTREGIRPYLYDDMIECWLGESSQDPAHADFWRASPNGYLFLLRGHQEDSTEEMPPATFFDLTLPVWRVSECLLHAGNFTTQVSGDDTEIRIAFGWNGLAGRELTSWANRNRMFFEGKRTRQDSFQREIVVTPPQIRDNLPEIVAEIVNPLFELFDFFLLPAALPAEEISRMLRGQ